MSAAALSAPAPAFLPAVNARLVVTLITAGAFATIAFDLFGQALSPLFGYARLAPVGLAQQTINVVFGVNSSPLAHLLHYSAGLIAYPVGWLFIARPLVRRLTPVLPWPVTSVIYGVGLWVFALYVMAHLVAGNPAFLGFSGITWVALWGHVVYALAAAAVVAIRERA